MDIQRILKRIEQGMAGVEEAAAIEEYLDVQAVFRAASVDGWQALQHAVAEAARVDCQAFNDGEFAAQQVVKAQVALGQLMHDYELPPLIAYAALPDAVAEAFTVDQILAFDSPDAWDGCGPDIDADVNGIADKIAAVVTPLLLLASVHGIDLAMVIRRAAMARMRRGMPAFAD